MTWSRAPKPWWGEAILHATTTRNMTPTTANRNNAPPYTAATGRAPELSKLKPFGCLAFPNIPTIDMGGKLNHGARQAILFGYGLSPDGTINGYRCYNLNTNRVTIKHDVTFNVDVSP